MTISDQNRRRELEEEYRVWAQMCLDKHGLPWPVKDSDLNSISDQELSQEVKKLKVLGRTPHEG